MKRVVPRPPLATTIITTTITVATNAFAFAAFAAACRSVGSGGVQSGGVGSKSCLLGRNPKDDPPREAEGPRNRSLDLCGQSQGRTREA